MIAFVEGTVDEVDGSSAVIDVGGIGFAVAISGETAARLSSYGKDDKVKLYTYLNVDREGAMSLIGFLSKDELSLFRLLITVNGVGPRAGLSLISAVGADELRFAIVSGDAKSIAKAPGVGKKTADRLVLELRDKLSSRMEEGDLDSLSANAGMAGGAGGQAGAAGTEAGTAGSDAILALAALGYTRMEATNAVHQAWKDLTQASGAEGAKTSASEKQAAAPEDLPDTETLLKAALRYLG